MRQGSAIVLGLVLALSSAGCRSCALVESQLAARESDVRVLKEELARSAFLADALSKELSALRGVPGPDGILRPPTEPYPVRSLRLGSLTSARPSDVLPGDDALQVQIEPLDTEKQAIKAPGSARIVALEVTEGGNKRILSMWDVPPEELRNSWQTGLFNTGYVLTFKFKELPTEARLRPRRLRPPRASRPSQPPPPPSHKSKGPPPRGRGCGGPCPPAGRPAAPGSPKRPPRPPGPRGQTGGGRGGARPPPRRCRRCR